jgi:hypothetical protein
MDRRAFLSAGGALALVACARPLGDFEDTSVAAPQWHERDSWTFRREDGYNRRPRGVLTRTVVAVNPSGSHRVVTTDENGVVRDDALFDAPGVQVSGVLSEDGPVGGLFEPRLIVYDFPLQSGKDWRQSLFRSSGSGMRIFMTVSSRVEGWEQVSAGDHSYRAIIVRRQLNMGARDHTTTSRPLLREEIEWYVPELRGPARLRTNEWYTSVTGRDTWPGFRFVYTLESFRLA